MATVLMISDKYERVSGPEICKTLTDYSGKPKRIKNEMTPEKAKQHLARIFG